MAASLRITGQGGKSYLISGGEVTPENSIIGSPGDLYVRSNGNTGELWQKASGFNTNTGWTQFTGSTPTGGVQVPISFTAINEQQTYSLPELVAGAVLDQVTTDSSILSPILGASGFITQAVGSLTFKAPAFTGGEQIVILWHLP